MPGQCSALSTGSLDLGGTALKYCAKMTRVSFYFTSHHYTAVVEEVIYGSYFLKQIGRVLLWCAKDTLVAYRNQPSQDSPHRGIGAGLQKLLCNVRAMKGVLTITRA